ncbi:MAG TPA: hypothetical protein VGE26_05255 [Sphingobacteriaceae bacterium]
MQLTEKDSQFLKSWEKTRLNKWRYIVLRFVILWGLLAAVFSQLVSRFLPLLNASSTDTDLAIPFFMLLGFVMGYVQYEGLEKRYQELKNTTTN